MQPLARYLSEMFCCIADGALEALAAAVAANRAELGARRAEARLLALWLLRSAARSHADGAPEAAASTNPLLITTVVRAAAAPPPPRRLHACVGDPWERCITFMHWGMD